MLPPAPAGFAGRTTELERLFDALARVNTAVIYGIAGSGKSALAAALAQRWPGRAVHHTVTPNQSIRAITRATREQLDSSAAGEDVLDLGRLLDEHAALIVLDDVHHLPEADRTTLLSGLGRALRQGRLVATSRELIPVAGPDRIEVRLSGLDLASAGRLWSALDELYSPTYGFEVAWERSRGNPHLLRCAHAGDFESNPISDAVASFDEAELRLAGALAMCEARLPAVVLPLDLRDALRRLVRRLVVDVDGAGFCSLDELHRDAVLDHLSVEQRQIVQAEIVELIERTELDAVTKVREACTQLRALGRYEDAGARLLAHADTFVKSGAAEELLAQIETIPRDRRSVELCLARAQVLIRVLDVRRAYEELERLLHAGCGPRHEIRMMFAKVAALAAQLPAAEEVMRDVLADPPSHPVLLMRAQIVFALVRAYQGHIEEGRVFIDEIRRAAAHPFARGTFALLESFMLWLDERDAEALEYMRTGSAILRDEPSGFVRDVLAPGLAATLLARHGRFEEADEAARAAESALLRYPNSRARMAWRAIRLMIPYERGERLRALAEVRQQADTFERGGDVLSLLWARAWVGRVLLILGRRREALAILNETEQWARARGVMMVVRAVERSHKEDPLVQIYEPAPRLIVETKRGAAVRARAIAAIRAARSGAALEVRGLLDANAAIAVGPDFALDRALARLAQAVLLRSEGRADEAGPALEEAARMGIEAGADADLIPALAEAVGALRLVTPAARGVMTGAAADLSGYEVVLDGRAQELRSGRRVVSFKRRPVLRRLLHALANRPGVVVAKEELAGVLWPGVYNPLVHDNSLKVNVRHLRQLLGRAGLAIEFEDVGYRLVVPERFVYIDQS